MNRMNNIHSERRREVPSGGGGGGTEEARVLPWKTLLPLSVSEKCARQVRRE